MINRQDVKKHPTSKNINNHKLVVKEIPKQEANQEYKKKNSDKIIKEKFYNNQFKTSNIIHNGIESRKNRIMTLSYNLNKVKHNKENLLSSINKFTIIKTNSNKKITLKRNDEEINSIFNKKINSQMNESGNVIKIWKIIEKMNKILSCNLKNLNEFYKTEENNINDYFQNQNELKFGLFSYDVESLNCEAKEFYDNLYEKTKENNYSDHNNNILDRVEFDNSLTTLSEDRISYYNKCFDICTNSIEDIIFILIKENKKEDEFNDIIKNNFTNFINNTNNNVTLNLNINLQNLEKMSCDKIKSEFLRNNFKNNLKIDSKNNIKYSQTNPINLFSYLSQTIKKKETEYLDKITFIDYTANTSNINEDVQIYIPDSKEIHLKSPFLKQKFENLFYDSENSYENSLSGFLVEHD